MLQYLQGHTRPDITFAVSQCSCYMHQHKTMYVTALKKIGRYLLKASEKASFCNLHMKPQSSVFDSCKWDGNNQACDREGV